MKKRKFGELDGRSVDAVTLESADAAVTILSYGCVTQDWRVDGPSGSLPMVLGFPGMDGYVNASRSHGAIVGRIANRTRNARFDFDGRTWELTPNTGPNKQHHSHGGAIGLGKRNWTMETDSAAGTVALFYASPDGEEGYPGAVDFTVTFRLDGPTLVCEMAGVPDRPTPVNLASHTYYNLGGTGSVRDHVLYVDAETYTPLDAESIPTGEIAPVEGTHLDFRAPREIEASDPERKGIDNNFILRQGRDPSAVVAWARCPRTGMRLSVVTDQPGLQVFNAPTMTVAAPGHGGERYLPYAGLCFEAQHFPDSMHHPEWPSIIVTPEHPYFQRLAIGIARSES